jgi:hypothetical protein
MSVDQKPSLTTPLLVVPAQRSGRVTACHTTREPLPADLLERVGRVAARLAAETWGGRWKPA